MVGVLLEAKVHSDGGEVAFLEGIVAEPPQKGAFAYGAVADDDDLKQVIVFSDHYD